MTRLLRACAPWMLAVIVAACGGSGSAPTPTGPSPTPSPAPAPAAPSPSPSPSPAPSSCAIALDSLPSVIPAKEEQYPFTLTTGAGCSWTIRSDAPWADITPGSGAGNGALQLNAAQNTRSDSRTAVLTVNSQTFHVRQEGVACTYALSTAALDARNEGGELSVRVIAPASCQWSVTTSASWITLRTRSASGTDYAYFTVAANTGAARQAVVTVAGQPVSITQAAG